MSDLAPDHFEFMNTKISVKDSIVFEASTEDLIFLWWK